MLVFVFTLNDLSISINLPVLTFASVFKLLLIKMGCAIRKGPTRRYGIILHDRRVRWTRRKGCDRILYMKSYKLLQEKHVIGYLDTNVGLVFF